MSEVSAADSNQPCYTYFIPFISVLCPGWSVLAVLTSVLLGHGFSLGASYGLQLIAPAVTWTFSIALVHHTTKSVGSRVNIVKSLTTVQQIVSAVMWTFWKDYYNK